MKLLGRICIRRHDFLPFSAKMIHSDFVDSLDLGYCISSNTDRNFYKTSLHLVFDESLHIKI